MKPPATSDHPYSTTTSTYAVASSIADVRTVTASRQVPASGTLTWPRRWPRPVVSRVMGSGPVWCAVRVSAASISLGWGGHPEASVRSRVTSTGREPSGTAETRTPSGPTETVLVTGPTGVVDRAGSLV